MSFSYSKKLSGDVKPLIDTAKRITKATGTKMSGDENKGTFSGKTVFGEIGGSYLVKDGVIKITIHKKPFLVPEAKLVAALDKFFS